MTTERATDASAVCMISTSAKFVRPMKTRTAGAWRQMRIKQWFIEERLERSTRLKDASVIIS
jgi:hypothetical protein